MLLSPTRGGKRQNCLLLPTWKGYKESRARGEVGLGWGKAQGPFPGSSQRWKERSAGGASNAGIARRLSLPSQLCLPPSRHRAAFPPAPAAIPGAFLTISFLVGPARLQTPQGTRPESKMGALDGPGGLCVRNYKPLAYLRLEKKGTEEASSTQNTCGKDLVGALHCQAPPMPRLSNNKHRCLVQCF